MKFSKLKPIQILLMLILIFSFSLSMNFADKSLINKEIELKEINNIPYYEEGNKLNSDLTQLNLIIPVAVENPPVFLWIGGGAWAYVDRHREMDLCRNMAKQGILVVSVGHRLSPQLLYEQKNPEGIKHPAHIKDVAQAFKWVIDNAEKYAYSTENIFVGGFSSGAHLATLLAADERYLKKHDLSPKNIKAIIPVGGGYDIPRYKTALFEEDPTMIERHINPVFGSTNAAHLDASPITYLDHFNTPMLMISESDTYQYSVVFEQALKAKEIKHYQVLNCHNETHSSLWKKLSWAETNMYRNYMVEYIKSQSE